MPGRAQALPQPYHAHHRNAGVEHAATQWVADLTHCVADASGWSFRLEQPGPHSEVFVLMTPRCSMKAEKRLSSSDDLHTITTTCPHRYTRCSSTAVSTGTTTI